MANTTSVITFTLLIVEDSFKFRHLLEDVVRYVFPSINIELAANWLEADNCVRGTLPDLILMDIRLPTLSGIDLTKKYKHLYPNVAIAILTEYDFEEYKEATKRAGADAFFVKDHLSDVVAFIAEQVEKKK